MLIQSIGKSISAICIFSTEWHVLFLPVLKVLSALMEISKERVQLVAGGMFRMGLCIVPTVSFYPNNSSIDDESH